MLACLFVCLFKGDKLEIGKWWPWKKYGWSIQIFGWRKYVFSKVNSQNV